MLSGLTRQAAIFERTGVFSLKESLNLTARLSDTAKRIDEIRILRKNSWTWLSCCGCSTLSTNYFDSRIGLLLLLWKLILGAALMAFSPVAVFCF
jgi:hypothetical protein